MTLLSWKVRGWIEYDMWEMVKGEASATVKNAAIDRVDYPVTDTIEHVRGEVCNACWAMFHVGKR